MKKTLLLLLAFCFTLPLLATDKEMSLSFDVGGPSTIVQMEADIKLIQDNDHYFGLSGGAGVYIGSFAIPLGAQYRYGDKHQLETGVYYIFLSSTNGAVGSMAAKVGYRLNFSNAYFHIYFSPFLDQSKGMMPWGGLGFGVYLD